MYHDTLFTNNDRIQVQVDAGSGYQNVGNVVSRYDGSTGWKLHTVDLLAYAGQSNVSVAFLGIGAYGSNMFLDDVAIIQPCSQPTGLGFTYTPLSPRVGQPVTFTGSATGTLPLAYTWNFGDGQLGTGAISTHTYATAGAFTVTATVTNSVGTQISTTVITINDVPISGLNAVNNSPTLLGQTTRLTATISTGSNVTYAWNFGDGQLGAGATVSRTYATVGIYTAAVTATNSVSTVVANTTVTITSAGDGPITGVSAANSSPTVLGQVTYLTATATGNNITYAWAFGDGQLGAGATVSRTYATVGIYTAAVTVTNSVSTVVANTTVTITGAGDGPITNLSAANSSPTVLGQVTYLTATATGNNITYAWAFGDGQLGAGATVSRTYATVGIYTAAVTATNNVSTVVVSTGVTIVPSGYKLYLPLILRGA